jgi:hypothetical protein
VKRKKNMNDMEPTNQSINIHSKDTRIDFPRSEIDALHTLGWAYNPFSGMNVLRLRDNLLPFKPTYSNDEICEMFLAGLALHSMGVVEKIQGNTVTWAEKEKLPIGLASPVLFKNTEILISLGHPSFESQPVSAARGSAPQDCPTGACL